MYQRKMLTYSIGDLEPWISEMTMYYQNRFYDEALTQLNQLLPGNRPLQQVVQNIDDYPLEKRGDILYLAGRVLNHELYFDSMSPQKRIVQ